MTRAVHATAVAIGGDALLICGPSRAGKSRLAAWLIARSTPEVPIKLIGDDRILLYECASRLLARPHPRIAGFLERRGLGIVAMDWVAEAPVGGILQLHMGESVPPPPRMGDDGQIRRLSLSPLDAQPDRVLAWWASRDAAAASHPLAKAAVPDWPRAKD